MMSTRHSFVSAASVALGLALSLSSCAATGSHRISSTVVSQPTSNVSSLRRGRPPVDDDDVGRGHADLHVPGWKDEAPTEAILGPGLYLSLNVNNSDILGDFDGDTAIVNDVTTPTQFVFVPDIETTEGIGADLSNRWKNWEIGLGYKNVNYDASFSATPIKNARFKYVDLMFKRHYMTDKPLQPFLTAGLGWSKASIRNGANDNGTFERGKLLNGINYNVGGGVTFAFSPWIAVYAQMIWRFGRYDSVDGPFGTKLANQSVDSDAWEFSTGVNIRLLPER